MHNIAADAGKSIRIHLDINSSGMSRHSLDVSTPLGPGLRCRNRRASPWLQLAGIMTHFPTDDNRHIEQGLWRFHSQAMTLLQLTGIPREDVLLHCANSYAAMHMPGSWLDMVRAGAVLYGDSDPAQGQFRTVPRASRPESPPYNSYATGSKVGYGLTHTLTRDSRLASRRPQATATGTVGPWHARAAVLVHGRRAAIVDLVSMNSMVVDAHRHRGRVSRGRGGALRTARRRRNHPRRAGNSEFGHPR